MDPTPENAPCWQDQYCPKEIFMCAHAHVAVCAG